MSRRRNWGAGEFGTTSTAAGEPKACEGLSTWHVCENAVPSGLDNHVNEALFALGNGFIGVRGTFEEGYAGPLNSKGEVPSEQGIFINGFYDEHVIKYPEVGYGQPEKDSVMLNVTNSKIIKMTVDGEPFDMYHAEAKVEQYYRQLNLKEGTLTRELVWTSPKGKKLKLETLRMVPLDENRKNVYVQEYVVTPLSENIDSIVIQSEMNGKVTNKPQSKDPRVGAGFTGQVLKMKRRAAQDPKYSFIESRTTCSNLSLMCGMANTMTYDDKVVEPDCSEIDEQAIRHEFTIPVHKKKDAKIVLRKYVVYVSTQCFRDEEKSEGDCSEYVEKTASKVLKQTMSVDFSKLLDEQKVFLANYYETATIDIKGDDMLQQGLRFNIFHLLQAVGRDGITNVGAKGISGEGYNGHYFWDTEIYILPFFLYSRPDIARNLVQFRVGTLDKARQRAQELGGIKKGALYPWRTIHGDECSAYFPAGTAQLHINADIAWAFKQYMEATDDTELLIHGGAEMILEMARFWLEYGNWSPAGHFQINCVTGPDEYTCLVNNNYYTNIMVQDALSYAVDIAYQLRYEHGAAYEQLCSKISLDESELNEMKKAADKMYLPYDKYIGVHPQDDSFLQKKPWDFENTPADKYPLLMNFHYLVIYKFKVLKQADLVLALLLQSDKFTENEKKVNFDYYEPLTTHDSSLSTAVYSVVAAEIGYYQKAYNYFKCTARMDLDNIHNNSQHGIHTACMAGTWMCVVRGFAGFSVYNNVVHLNPYLPQEWKGYSFKLTYKGAVLKVEVNSKTVVYTCVNGGRINFVHGNTQKIYLKKGRSKEVLLKDKFEDLTTLNFDSVVIDLDAAIPTIQQCHFESWREVLTTFFEQKLDIKNCGLNSGFTVNDYLKDLRNQIASHRFAGLETFLKKTTGLDIPVGSSHDLPGYDTLWALGNKKTEVFRKMIEENPPQASLEMLQLFKTLKNEGMKLGLVTYSKSGESLIQNSGLKRYVDAYVTGTEMGALGLRGKPHMDMYERVVEQLFTDASRCVVIINDPIGFDPVKIARFKYSISFPSPIVEKQPWTAEELAVIEQDHHRIGIQKVVKDLPSCLNVDVMDEWVTNSEPYEDRIARIYEDGSKKRAGSFQRMPSFTVS
ncbi:hypothetical protein DIPPA_05219 [Diplonema papillatum]|nr:hypothetical protein DIPPA_05219 [Diplonema papillatum]